MSPHPVGEVAGRLREVLAALERRVKRPERDAEADIARDAQAMRQKAQEHLDEIEVASAPSVPRSSLNP